MKLSYVNLTLLSSLIVVLFACTSKNPEPSMVSRADSIARELEKQKHDLQEQKEELERKNATLTQEKEKRESAERARQEEENRTFSRDAAVGMWNVKLTCVESDCEGRSAGDVYGETWNIAYLGGKYRITVDNPNGGTNRSYEGDFDGRNLRVSFAQGNDIGYSAAKVKVDMRMKDDNTMTGNRQVLNSGPCTISYRVKATRYH